MGRKPAFGEAEVSELKRLYLQEGKSCREIAKILQKGSGSSVRLALLKAGVDLQEGGARSIEKFNPGDKYAKITLLKKIQSAKQVRFLAICDCGFEFELDPYRLTFSDENPDKVTQCVNCNIKDSGGSLLDFDEAIAKEADGWNPSLFSAKSGKRMGWICSEGHSYKAIICNRTLHKSGCPYCANKKVMPGFNDLRTRFPEMAKQALGWNPSEVMPGSDTPTRDWICDLGHVYDMSPNQRTARGDGCPYCSNRRVLPGFNDLKTKFPEIAKEAYGWDPSQVIPGSNEIRKWICSEGHIFSQITNNRTSKGQGCPSCAESGFSPERDAWMYLMERPGEQQFGISNVIKDRLATHRREGGWELLEYIGPFKGDEVYMCELAVKRWLELSVGTTPGHSENWFTKDLEVQSLKQLFDTSGISNEFRLPTHHPTYK
jgi:hypothetical protein